MSEAGMAVVIFVVLAALAVMSYWRQILVSMLSIVFAVFCVGLYSIVATLFP